MQYTDKQQIMDNNNNDPSNFHSTTSDFMDHLVNNHHRAAAAAKDDLHHHHHIAAKEDHHHQQQHILRNYDFHPNFNSDPDGRGGGDSRVWPSADYYSNFTTPPPTIKDYGSLDAVDPSKITAGKDLNSFDVALISEIDKTIKKHTDNLLHILDGVSSRLSQLESRSFQLETSLNDLKISVGNNYGSTRQIENIIREVQDGVQVISKKQEKLESQLELSKVQVLKAEQQSETQNPGYRDSMQQAASAPMQSHHQLPPDALTQPSQSLTPPNAPPLPSALDFTSPNAPPPPPPLNLTSTVHHPDQYSQNMPIPQSDSYLTPPGQTSEVPTQSHQQPPPRQLQPPPTQLLSQYHQTPQLQYSQQLSQAQYSQPTPPPQQFSQPHFSQPTPPPQQHPSLLDVNPSRSQPPVGYQSEETRYVPSQIHPSSNRQPSGAPPSQQFYTAPSHMYESPSSRPALPSQQFYTAPSHMYETSSKRPDSAFSGLYGSSAGQNEPYPFAGSPSPYPSDSPRKPQHSSAFGPSTGSGYSQLPTARILPPSRPASAGVGGGSGSGGTGNRVPIDDVVDKVTNMGFPRDQVRATVRKLTENGQSVDLNVVLDKLMTDGVEAQQPRGWYGQ